MLGEEETSSISGKLIEVRKKRPADTCLLRVCMFVTKQVYFNSTINFYVKIRDEHVFLCMY